MLQKPSVRAKLAPSCMGWHDFFHSPWSVVTGIAWHPLGPDRPCVAVAYVGDDGLYEEYQN